MSVRNARDRFGIGMRWFWFSPMPVRRVEILRSVLYGFIFIDVLLTTRWVAAHVDAPQSFYEPLLIARVLHLPRPTATAIIVVEIALLLFAGIAAFRRGPRAAGVIVFFLYFAWMLIAMSYGKVDHDRFAFLVALAVLPTI